MRRHVRRCLFYFVFIFVFVVVYQVYSGKHEIILSQSPFIIIYSKNRTYRILSSSFKYNSRESYLNFAYFHVEQRSRVSHIDYKYDVPVSSQWQSSGHFYPTQIAQFGLSHWSRLHSNTRFKQNIPRTFERIQPNKNDDCSSSYTVEKDISISDAFVHFIISSNCSLHFQFLKNNIELIYSTTTNNHHSQIRPTKIIIPIQGYPRRVNRHMLIDIEKSIRKSLFIKHDSITVRVCGQSNSFVDQLTIGNETLYSQQAFYSATNWLLNNQDFYTGCWLIHVKRSFGKKNQYHLRSPWCSAMAQGQAASLLVRLYSLTHDAEHLQAIRRTVQPLWESNITRAYYQNYFLWLEEYPLEKPAQGLFVLNGCLYALLGIIDTYAIDPHEYLLTLINDVLTSLNHMLPYYVHPKISNWSLYDLSHVTMDVEPNTASYSYHLTHIILLQCLSQLLKTTNVSMSQFLNLYVRQFTSSIL